MLAILLNSGVGSRMGGLTEDRPKCMMELSPGVTIISRQIELLTACGIDRFVVTTGYMADALRNYLKARFPAVDIVYVHNERYLETNYIVSLHNAASITREDIALLHGDLVFSLAAARMVLEFDGSAVAVDSTLPLSDKDFMAWILPGGRVAEIGVRISGAGCLACQPFYKLRKSDWLLWQRSIEDFCMRGLVSVYAESAFNAVSSSICLMGADLRGELCMEVDDPNDLEKIRRNLG